MCAKQKLVSPPQGGGTILDKESYDTLLAMLKSRDEANYVIVQTILTQCNVEKSIYWIRELAINGYYVANMVNLRTKLGRQFRDDSNLFWLSSSTNDSFVRWLKKKGWLTPWIWNQLRDKITETYERHCRNEYFNVILTLKPEYEVYNIDPQQLKIVEDGDQTS